MGVLALLSIYVKEIFFSILAVFGIDKSEGNYMQIVYIAMTTICVLTFIYQAMFKVNVSKREIAMIFAFALLLVAFMFVPRILYRNPGSIYQAQLLTAFSSVLSAFLMGILVKRGNFINDVGRAVPWFVIINTLTSTFVTFNSSGRTSGGYLMDSSGFNYQDLSYFIAYTFALNVFYIKNQHRIEGKSVFKRPGWNTFFQCLIPLHMLTVLLVGGRGAFILICLLSVYYFVMDSSDFGKNFKNFVIMAITALVVFVVVTGSSLEYSGFERILKLLDGVGDSGRIKLREQAFDAFLRSPLIGNGSGSVYPILKIYSHNFFTDIITEYGAVGLVVTVVLLEHLIKGLYRSVRENPCNHILVIVFICCFTLLMFSGYYLSSTMLWFVVGYTFSTVSQKPQQKKLVSKYVKIH